MLKNIICSLSIILALNSSLSAETKVKIGAILPLTGPVASVGESVKNSMLLADKKFDTDNLVDFIFEDDGFIPKNTVSAFKKLSDQNEIEGLFVFGSNTSLSIADIAEHKQLPMISIAMTDSLAQNKKFVVRYCATPESLDIAAKKEVLKRGYKNVAILSTQHDGMLDIKHRFKKNPPVEIIFDQDFIPEDRDFRTTVTQIVNLNPDAIYVLLMPPQLAIFAKQIRSLGYRGEFFGAPPLGERTQIKVADGALDQAWYVTGNDLNAKDFYEQYNAKFAEEPVVEAIYAYDIAKLLIEAAYSGDINQGIHRASGFHGVMGNLGIDESNSFAVPIGVHKITKDGIERLG